MNTILLKTRSFGQDLIKNLCKKTVPYFTHLEEAIIELKEGKEKEIIMQSLKGWAMAEIEGSIESWKKIAIKLLKRFFDIIISDTDIKNNKKSKKGILRIDKEKKCLAFLFFRQMYDAGVFPDCTIDMLAKFLNQLIDPEINNRTISNCLAKLKVDVEKDFVYFAHLYIAHKKIERLDDFCKSDIYS